MQVRYHPGAFPEADITASPAEFAAVANRIAALVATGTGKAIFAAGKRQRALLVEIGSGPVVVALSDGILSVSGSAEAIELFAGNMPVEASLPAGYHVHFEHAGREWFVAAQSVPLVLMVGSSTDAEPEL